MNTTIIYDQSVLLMASTSAQERMGMLIQVQDSVMYAFRQAVAELPPLPDDVKHSECELYSVFSGREEQADFRCVCDNCGCNQDFEYHGECCCHDEWDEEEEETIKVACAEVTWHAEPGDTGLDMGVFYVAYRGQYYQTPDIYWD
jgi:hypothetical protein